MNNVLPARLGELARAYMLWHRERIEPGVTIATIILERVLDGLTLLVFAGRAALVVPFPTELQRAAWATAALFDRHHGAGRFPGSTRAVRGPGHPHLPAPAERFALLGERLVLCFVDGLAVLRDPRSLVTVLGLSLSAWLAEATMYFVIMLGFPFPARSGGGAARRGRGEHRDDDPLVPGYVGTFDLPLQSLSPRSLASPCPRRRATRSSSTPRLSSHRPAGGILHLARLAQRGRGRRGDGRGSLLGGLQAMRSGGGHSATVNGHPPSGEPVGSGQRSAKR